MRIRWTAQTGSCALALFLFVTACGDRGSESASIRRRKRIHSQALLASAPFRPRRPCEIDYGSTRSPHTWFQKW